MVTTQDPFRYSALRGVGAPESSRAEPPDSSSLVSVRYGRILVVDDELSICSSLKRVFSRHHTVSTVTSAQEALDLLRSGERFDIVLCDLMMPEMNGLDLFLEVSRAMPDQGARFVFMSGASLSAQVSSFLATIPNTLIAKPFDMRLLVELVRERLATK